MNYAIEDCVVPLVKIHLAGAMICFILRRMKLSVRPLIVLLTVCTAVVPLPIVKAQEAAVKTNTLPRVSVLPESEDLFLGEGPIQRAGWFKGLWSALRAEWWKNRERDKGAVVFLGDSITQGWGSVNKYFPGTKIANRGISGDTSRGVLFRLREDVLDLEPKAVVLLIGTNDIELSGTPEQIAHNIQLILAAIKAYAPKTPVILCKVMPASEKVSRPADKIRALNLLIDDMTKNNPQVITLDTWSIFADETGSAKKEQFPDLLHPNEAGYATWAEALKPAFASLKLEKASGAK